jgi:beta-lactamase regulating signal transducer with metallopeptidase domain
MNAYADIVLFAVVFAVNLFLLGAIIAAGLGLSFRFIKNVSPRLRYIISVSVFLMAVALPFAVTLKIPFGQRSILTGFSEIKPQEDGKDSLKQAYAVIQESTGISDFNKTPENSSANFINDFTLFIAASVIGSVFPGLWISGIGYFLFREAAGFWQLRRARKGWTLASDWERENLLCPKEIALYFDENQSPGTVGFLYPVIVLPKNFPDDLLLDAQRLIAQHELAHARWRDPLIKYLLRLIRAFFWVSPTLWLLERLISSEREAAADHAAITYLSNESELKTKTLIYADTLVAVAKQFNSFGRQSGKPQTIGMGSGESELEHRIRRLLSSSQTTCLHIASATIVLVLTLAVLMVIPLAALSDKAISGQQERVMLIDDSVDQTMNNLPIGNQVSNLPQPDARVRSEKTNQQVPVSKPQGNEYSLRNEKLSRLTRLKGNFSPLNKLQTDTNRNEGLVRLKALEELGSIKQKK